MSSPLVFSVTRAHLHLGRGTDPKSEATRREFSDDVNDRTRRCWFNRDRQELAASCRGSGMAPTLLLSVSMRCTEHQRLIREAWQRALLLELGVTLVNPSCRRALAPARRSPTRDRSVGPSKLHRFQLCAVWNNPGLQIAPEGD